MAAMVTMELFPSDSYKRPVDRAFDKLKVKLIPQWGCATSKGCLRVEYFIGSWNIAYRFGVSWWKQVVSFNKSLSVFCSALPKKNKDLFYCLFTCSKGKWICSVRHCLIISCVNGLVTLEICVGHKQAHYLKLLRKPNQQCFMEDLYIVRARKKYIHIKAKCNHISVATELCCNLNTLVFSFQIVYLNSANNHPYCFKVKCN